MYLDDGGRPLAFASKAGADTNLDWYHNLLAYPDTSIEVGDRTFEAHAVNLRGGERERLFAQQTT